MLTQADLTIINNYITTQVNNYLQQTGVNISPNHLINATCVYFMTYVVEEGGCPNILACMESAAEAILSQQ